MLAMPVHDCMSAYSGLQCWLLVSAWQSPRLLEIAGGARGMQRLQLQRGCSLPARGAGSRRGRTRRRAAARQAPAVHGRVSSCSEASLPARQARGSPSRLRRRLPGCV